MLSGDILEHRLVESHFAHSKRKAQRADRQKDKGNQKRRKRGGYDVQGEVAYAREDRAERKAIIARLAGNGGEIALPKHEQPCGSHAEEHAARKNEKKRVHGQVHGGDDA